MRKHVAISLIFLLFLSCKKPAEEHATYIMKIGDVTITKEQLQKELENLPPDLKGFFAGKEGLNNFAGEMSKREMLVLEAKKLGLDNDPEYLAKVDECRKLNLISIVIQKSTEKDSQVTEKDARDFYDKNPDQFVTADKVKARHILVETEKEAADVYKELKAGADFAGLARKHSLDKGSAEKGGDLGFFGRGQMQPEFEEAAFTLKQGEASSPVKTRFGYHIIEVTENQKGKKADFDTVKDLIVQVLSGEKQKQVLSDYVAKVQKAYQVQTNQKALEEFIAANLKKTIKEEEPRDPGPHTLAPHGKKAEDAAPEDSKDAGKDVGKKEGKGVDTKEDALIPAGKAKDKAVAEEKKTPEPGDKKTQDKDGKTKKAVDHKVDTGKDDGKQDGRQEKDKKAGDKKDNRKKTSNNDSQKDDTGRNSDGSL